MKLKDAGTRGASGGRRPPPGNIGPIRSGMRGDIRMEWMDPMSWRLPSGKALAEFALQAGFLAPLMLVGPRYKKPKKAAGTERPAEMGTPGVGTQGVGTQGMGAPGMGGPGIVERAGVVERTDKQYTEVPGLPGSFRDDRQAGV